MQATLKAETLKPWLWRICVATALLQAVFYAVRVLVSYRILALGGDATTIGAITAVFSLAPLLIAIQIGRAVDRNYARAIFGSGTALTALGCLVLAASDSIWLIGLGAVMVGTGQLLATVASQSFISMLATPTEMGLDRGFAALTLSVSIGQAIGVPFVGAITTHHSDGTVDTTLALLVMALVGAASLPFVVWLRQPGTRAATGAVARQSIPAMLRLPGLTPAMFSSLVVLSAMDLTVAYMPLLGQELGFSVAMVSLLITVRTVASIFSRALLPLLLRVVSRRLLLISATLVPAIPMAAIPFVGSPWIIAVLMAIAGVFWGIGQPLTMTWVVGLVTPENRGAALSLRMTGNRLGQVAVPIGAGFAAGLGGSAAVFVITGGLLATAAASTTKATGT